MAVTKKINPEIAKIIRAWREGTSRTRLGLSQELGVAKTSVSNWELAQNEPPVDVLIALAERAEGKFKHFFLLQARQKSGLTGNALDSIMEIGIAPTETLEPGKERRKRTRRASPFVEVRLMTGMAGAGPAYVNDREQIEGTLSIPKDICPNPAETYCIRVRGESMHPTISDGTIAAVDGSQRRTESLTGMIVAAFHETEGVLVKRLVRVGQKRRLASDNPGHGQFDLDDGWKIIGAVIWWIQKA